MLMRASKHKGIKYVSFKDGESSITATLLSVSWYLYVDGIMTAQYDYSIDITTLLEYWNRQGRQDGALKILLDLPRI